MEMETQEAQLLFYSQRAPGMDVGYTTVTRPPMAELAQVYFRCPQLQTVTKSGPMEFVGEDMAIFQCIHCGRKHRVTLCPTTKPNASYGS